MAELQQDLEGEAALLSKEVLRHRHIVTFIGLLVDPAGGASLLMTDFAPNGSLAGLLAVEGRSDEGEAPEGTAWEHETALPWARRLQLGKQLLRGVAHLHAHQVIHRDLKPQNCLLDGHGDLRICDFGLSRIVPSLSHVHGSARSSTSSSGPTPLASLRQLPALCTSSTRPFENPSDEGASAASVAASPASGACTHSCCCTPLLGATLGATCAAELGSAGADTLADDGAAEAARSPVKVSLA